MNQVTRTAGELARAEKLFNEITAESRALHKSGLIPEELLEHSDEQWAAAYESYKNGEPDTQFEAILTKWEGDGEPTPALTEENNAQAQA